MSKGRVWLVLLGLLFGCGGLANGQGGASDGGTGGEGAVGPDGSRALTKVTKLDVLFDIDNSPSMGDKQAFLAAAIPDLVVRLIQPNCIVSVPRGATTIAGPSSNGSCAAYPGSAIEFPPVHDLHVGVISTSLGSRGVTGAGAVCVPSQMTEPFTNPKSPAIPSHTDDRAELLNRIRGPIPTETEGTSPDTGGQNFLDWFPTGAAWGVNHGKTATTGTSALSPSATPIGSAAQLEKDFGDLVFGVHSYGCGISSPIETWYRFLIQPDPYDSIVVGSDGVARWSGVDATIIKQRHDFLRPDSLVLIVDLSDKDDEEIDVRAFGGQAYKFMDQSFDPPRGTSACVIGPGSPECTSCAYGTAKTDPSCMTNGGVYSAEDDPGFYIGDRTVHMEQKYGLDPQFPLGRYVLGLTSPKVPDRDHEYPAGVNCYQGGVGRPSCTAATTLNTGDLDCTNPLFAATLPDGSDITPAILCNTSGAGGARTPNFVFYAHIGGVPHQLLQTTPGDSSGLCAPETLAADCPPKDTLLPADWIKILGKGWETLRSPTALTNPNQYDYSGIDPHMIEAFDPRPGLGMLTMGPHPMGGGPDPINGGEWVTDSLHAPPSLEYACIFSLATPRDCSNLADYAAQEACDCSTTGLPLDAIPSVCGLKDPSMPYAVGTNDYTTQYYAKTYPTTRELEVALLVGPQGIVASLCPIHATDNASGSDPLYGYRSVMTQVVNRLEVPLGGP